MNYFAYLLLGPWLGKVALLLMVLGIALLLIPDLTQPIHGYKIRKIAGFFVLLCAFLGSSWVLVEGHKPISHYHTKKLHDAINQTSEGNSVFASYDKDWGELTEIDYVTLKKFLARKSHPHFKHKQT